MATKDVTGEVRPGLFARRATGLVREIGAFDLFAYSVNNQNIGLGVLWFLLIVPAVYFGADLVWSVLIAGVLSFFVPTAYALLNTIVPRSGGDYVFVSRVFGPWIGFAGSWIFVIWAWFYTGGPAAFFGKYGLAGLLRYVGAITRRPGLIAAGEWFYSSWGAFIIGTVLIWLFIGLFIWGTKRYMRIQNVLFAIAMLGLVVGFLVMVTTSPAGFEMRFNDYVASLGGSENAYAKVQEMAANDPDVPLDIPPGINWKETLKSTIWGVYIMLFAMYAAYLGGEIKSARRTNMVALPLAVIVVTVIIAVLLVPYLRVVGQEWLAALAYFDPDNGMATAEKIGPILGMSSFAPNFNELAAIASPPIVGVFICFAFLFWTYAWMPISILSASRVLMAWGFDRLVPEKLSEVHPRFHTPVYALLLIGVMAEISLFLMAFGYMGLLSGNFSQLLLFAIVCATAMAIPYRLKETFEASPVAWRIAGIPVVSIIGFLGLISVGVIEYMLYTDVIVGIGGNKVYLYTNLGVFASGFILYPIIRAWRRSQGIDVELAAREIPPE